MIKLYGFSLSNYFNKVKLALLEKNVQYEVVHCGLPVKDEALKALSPLGKIPFIVTEQGAICESQVIMDYLEAAYPQPALLPSDPYTAAKVKELTTFVELHLELVARELYGQAFFGGTCSEANQERVRKLLNKNIPSFKALVKFSPYIAGDTFTQADCAAWVSLPVVAMATKIVLGEDMLLAHGIDWKTYSKFIGERPSAQRVTADRKNDEAKKALPPT